MWQKTGLTQLCHHGVGPSWHESYKQMFPRKESARIVFHIYHSTVETTLKFAGRPPVSVKQILARGFNLACLSINLVLENRREQKQYICIQDDA